MVKPLKGGTPLRSNVTAPPEASAGKGKSAIALPNRSVFSEGSSGSRSPGPATASSSRGPAAGLPDRPRSLLSRILSVVRPKSRSVHDMGADAVGRQTVADRRLALLQRSKPLRMAMNICARGVCKELKHEVAEYKSALRLLKSDASTAEEMDATYARLERAARTVLERADVTSSAGRRKAVLKDLHQRHASRLLRARDVEPCTLRQFELKKAFSRHAWTQVGSAALGIHAAQDLLDQVANDARHESSALERQYGQLWSEQYERLDQVAQLGEPRDPFGEIAVLPEALDAYRQAQLEFQHAWQRYQAAHEMLRNGADATEPDAARVREAFELLQEAQRRSEHVIAFHRTILDERIGRMCKERAQPGIPADDVRRLLSAPAISLCGLRVSQYEALVQGVSLGATNEREFASVAAQLHPLTAFDPEFLYSEAALRSRTIRELVRDEGEMLHRARADWANWSPEQRQGALQRILDKYCERLEAGSESEPVTQGRPAVKIEDLANPRIIGQYQHARNRAGVLRMNPKAYGADDFELVMSAFFHELTHYRQYQMMAAGPGSSASKLFIANKLAYNADESSETYRAQPLESHAFLAGRDCVRELVRALDEHEAEGARARSPASGLRA